MSGHRSEGAARLQRANPRTLRNWEPPNDVHGSGLALNTVVDCGWGRLLFAHTFEGHERVAEELRREQPDQRDIAFYLRDPHVVLSLAPHELFLDPSHTYRIWLDQYQPAAKRPAGFTLRRLHRESDAAGVRRILDARGMVSLRPGFLRENTGSRILTFVVAEDASDDRRVIGFVMGVDHRHAFDDPENGSSLWCLAVDPQAEHPGVGEALVRHLAEHYSARGRAFMDLSVMHDNAEAIRLYDKLGFQRVPVFAVKTKSAINEQLFVGPSPEAELNPYARIIVDEARRRGIAVKIVDAENGYFSLTNGGRTITCRESLSELTSAVAMSRCDDKAVTRRVLTEAGLRMPAQTVVAGRGDISEFLTGYPRVVVKPARGEQGEGVAVDLAEPEGIAVAVEVARQTGGKALLEEYVPGDDLRIVVIDDEVVAAAVRRPARVVGNGRDTVAGLIEKQSRRRAAATGGESRIPMDEQTLSCVKAAGFEVDGIPEEGTEIVVRKTANLHTGGTIHDVTDRLHSALAKAAVEAARALEIPVVGLDFIVANVEQPEYVIIEANERPGLANHEPAPTAQKFVDMLFPSSAAHRTGQSD